MTRVHEPTEDETTMTEITLQPDGRVFIFGTSRHVLDILLDLDPDSARLQRLISEVERLESSTFDKVAATTPHTTRRD
jgi:hypothetical protein